MFSSDSSSLSDSNDYTTKPKDRGPEKTKGDLVKDPIRCPLCLATLMCPRSKDPDDYIDRVLSSCLKGSDPGCQKQAANPKNAAFIEALQMRLSNVVVRSRNHNEKSR